MDWKQLVKERIESNLIMFTQEDIVTEDPDDDDYYLALADNLIDDKCLNYDLRDEIAKEFKEELESRMESSSEHYPVWIFSSDIASVREEIDRLEKENTELKKANRILTDGLIEINAEKKMLKKENENYRATGL